MPGTPGVPVWAGCGGAGGPGQDASDKPAGRDSLRQVIATLCSRLCKPAASFVCASVLLLSGYDFTFDCVR
jgi:hypothetical protein